MNEVCNISELSQQNRSYVFGWIAFALTASVFFANITLPHNSSPFIKFIGVAVLVVSAPLMFTPFLYLKKHGGILKGKAYHETTTVVEIGPYRLIRHPQYLGYILLVAGFTIVSYNLVTTTLALLGILFFYLQALAEEKQCLHTFGDQYREYSIRVPRFNLVLGVFRLLRHQK